MSPSGIDGPKGPGGPSGPKGIEGADGVGPTERPGEVFSLGESPAAGAAGQAEAVQDPVVMEAVTRVAADLQAGQIADMRAAVDAVLESIVAQRYPGMEPRQRQRLAVSLQRLLANDPGLGAQLAALIQSQQTE